MVKATKFPAAASGVFHLAGKQKINRMGFGAMRLTGENIWGPPKNPKECKEVLKKALELGVNLIDTADSYGPEVSENLIAETLYPYPSDLVIATKGGLTRPSPSQWEPNCKPEYLRKCVENSLRRLKLHRIDLYQLHCVDPKVPLEKSLEELRKLQEEDKIRFIGLSNFNVDQIKRARKMVDIVSVQNQYNLSQRQSDDVVDYCEENNLAFIPWFPVASGNLVHPGGKLEKIAKQKGATPAGIALAWLLKRSKVIVPIPGTSKVKHLEENVASATIELSDDEFKTLS